MLHVKLAKVILALSLVLLILIMADVEIDVSGNLSTPISFEKTGKGINLQKYFSVEAFKAWYASCKESIRPWNEFMNTGNFKLPQNFPRFMKRAVNNLKYFQGNYVIISVILMAYCLLTSPLLLLSIGVTLVACYMLSTRHTHKRLVVGGKDVSLQQQYAAVGICSLPLYYWAGIGQVVFWVLGASCFVISLHAATYNIEAVLKEEDQLELLLSV